MKVHGDAKLEKVTAGKDDPRIAIRHILVVAGDDSMLGMPEVFGRMLATNGRAIASVPVSLEDGDIPGFVTPESLKMCRALTNKEDRPAVNMLLGEKSVIADSTASFPRKISAGLVRDGEHVVVAGDDDERPDVVNGWQFPKFDSLFIPAADALASVRINPKLLYDLALALGSPMDVRISFFTGAFAVRVDGCSGDVEGAFGMLCCIKDDGVWTDLAGL